MQVQHELQLFGGPPLEAENFGPTSSQTIDSYTLSRRNFAIIEHIVCSPTSNVIAVYNYTSNQILIFDTKTYSIREKFPLKPCDKKFSKQSFALKGIDFSPDGTRLAIGQTDCIIYIYKLASTIQQQPSSGQIPSAEAGQPVASKLAITGKFVCASPVVSLIWTEQGIIFATQDGKIKLISVTVKSNSDNNVSTPSSSTKVVNIYSSPRGILPLSLAYKSPLLAIGLIDHNIVLSSCSPTDLQLDASAAFSLTGNSGEQPAASRRNSSAPTSHVIVHSCPPCCLAILQNNIVCAAGPDGRLALYTVAVQNDNQHQLSRNQEIAATAPTASTTNARLIHSFELKHAIRALDYSPTNELLAVAAGTRLVFIRYDHDSSGWHMEPSFMELQSSFNLASQLTCVRWIKDGCQLVAGTSMGSIELFRCTWNKQSITEQLDICHIAKNRVRITDRSRNLLATYKTQSDIKRVNLLDSGQSIIIWTSTTLLMARLGQPWQQSEINWSSRAGRSVKFCFNYSNYVLLYNSISHELLVIKLGLNDILQTIRMDAPKKSTVSVRQYPLDNSQQVAPSIQISPSTTNKLRLLSLATPAEPLEPQLDITERFAYAAQPPDHLILLDLRSGTRLLTKRHEESIMWLELSYTSNNLVFKDSSRRLYLLKIKKISDLQHGEPSCKELVQECEFADWLPETDILIVQSLHKILVWYNVEEAASRIEYDARAFNITNAAPIIDLSFAHKDPTKKPYPVIVRLTHQYQLHLTNGQTIQLDKTMVSFYTKLMSARLDDALEVLETSEKQLNNLWLKLGWLSIDQSNCRVARRAFEKLEHKSMVDYLDECLGCESADELGLRLAKLRGDWDLFEQLASAEQVVETYKRLNKWSQLIDYLNRSQKFRQRDLAEREHQKWLIQRGYFMESAQIQAKSGDLAGAIELLTSHERYEEACRLFVAEQKTSLAEREDLAGATLLKMAKELKAHLLDRDKVREAAELSEKVLGSCDEALDLYLQAKAFEPALELAKQSASGRARLGSVEKEFGEWLMDQYRCNRLSRKQASPAVEHFLTAGQASKALDAAIELKQWHRALDILRQGRGSAGDGEDAEDSWSEQAKVVAAWMIKKGRLTEACEAYELGGDRDLLVQLYIDQGDYETAYKTMMRQDVDADAIQEKFIRLAQVQTDEDAAERIYLMLDRAELAIEMRRRSKSYDRMLELIRQYQPDQVESSLLLLAREMESAGELAAAERYLLQASESEWTNVVRMYRLAGQWESAYRVAQANCASDRDPLLVQLAYWWCKSLNDLEAAHELLNRLGLVGLVLEFCCENQNFQFAIELAQCIPSPTGRDIHCDLVKRHARFLESQNKMRAAEQILVRYGLFEDAVRMYLDNELDTDALRVVEDRLKALPVGERDSEKLGELLNKTLVQCADRLAAQVVDVAGQPMSMMSLKGNKNRAVETMDKLAAAQQLYLRAQRPDLAVTLYQERGMWQEAIQVAQRFAPQLVEDVERALDAQVAHEVAPILATIRPPITNGNK